jgi:thiol-disulfide isomerase/thioredoxin
MMRTALTLTVLCGVAFAGGGGKIEWQKGRAIDDAVQEAKKSNKIVMAYFTADWCTYCKAQDEAAFSDDEVVKRSQAFIRVLVDCTAKDDLSAHSKTYGLMGVPAVVFLNGEGKAVDTVVGQLSAAGFLRHFDKLAPAVVPSSAPQDEASKRILDRITKEIEESQKRLREDIAKIVKSELEKSGVAQTVQPKKSVEAQIAELTPLLSEDGLTGKLKVFLKTKEGAAFVRQTLEQGNLDTVAQAVEQYFEKDAKGKLVLRAEFEAQVESMLAPKDPPKETPKKPAYLGISADDFTDDERTTLGLDSGAGLKLFEVKAESPAAKAGLKSGDVIVQIGAKNVTEKSMSEIVATFKAGDAVDFTIFRGKEKKVVKVTFGEKK